MVSSSGAGQAAALKDDVLARGPFSDVSRIAFDIAAVLPLRKASTILNLRTDCSSDVPFSGDVVLARDGVKAWPEAPGSREGTRATDILELLREGCWERGPAGGEVDIGGRGARPEVWEPSSDTASSSLRGSLSFRRRSDRAADLDLLCWLWND